MLTYLMIFNALVCLLLIAIVLIQFGKGAETGLMSSSMGDSMMTSAQRGSVLSKATVILALIFMVVSLTLSKLSHTESTESILDKKLPTSQKLNTNKLPGSGSPEGSKVKKVSATQPPSEEDLAKMETPQNDESTPIMELPEETEPAELETTEQDGEN
jgi:preprotein translocase subunit SecG